MLNISKFNSITSGKDLKKDIACYICPDGIKIYTDRYSKIELDSGSSILKLYIKNSKDEEILYEVFDVESILGIQYRIKQDNDLARDLYNSALVSR